LERDIRKIKSMAQEEKIVLTGEQRYKLEKLWMVYGNQGKKHTHHNHRFIQNILEHGNDTEDFYKEADKKLPKGHTSFITMELTEECISEVRRILANDTMEIGDVVNLISPTPSFSHNDGLKVVVGFEGNFVKLAKLGKDGIIEKYESGEMIVLLTGLKNEGIHKTNLTYKLD
jgi:hypothetical protein